MSSMKETFNSRLRSGALLADTEVPSSYDQNSWSGDAEGASESRSPPMRWCNSYVPQPRIAERTLPSDEVFGPDPYDVNFCFPYQAKSLESSTIRLVPFIPRLHAEKLFHHAVKRPGDLTFMRFPVPKTFVEMLTWFECHFRRDPSNMVFTSQYRDEAGNWTVAGIVALIGANPDTLTAEIGWGLVYPGTRGQSRGLGIISVLLRYCFNAPTDPIPGLGLRKVGWTVHSHNHAAQVLPLALGFRVESMRRWNRVAAEGKMGNKRRLPAGDPLGLPGIDDYYLVMCWDEWEMDGKDLSEAVLNQSWKAKL